MSLYRLLDPAAWLWCQGVLPHSLYNVAMPVLSIDNCFGVVVLLRQVFCAPDTSAAVIELFCGIQMFFRSFVTGTHTNLRLFLPQAATHIAWRSKCANTAYCPGQSLESRNWILTCYCCCCCLVGLPLDIVVVANRSPLARVCVSAVLEVLHPAVTEQGSCGSSCWCCWCWFGQEHKGGASYQQCTAADHACCCCQREVGDVLGHAPLTGAATTALQQPPDVMCQGSSSSLLRAVFVHNTQSNCSNVAEMLPVHHGQFLARTCLAVLRKQRMNQCIACGRRLLALGAVPV
jgi:hypothetical protein